MLSSEFDSSENLFRAIKRFPNWWDEITNLPTSAAFKDTLGVSIDRQGSRTIVESTKVLTERFTDLKAVVHITFNESVELGATAYYDPQENNIFHSILKQNDGSIPLTASIAKKLSRKVKISHLQ